MMGELNSGIESGVKSEKKVMLTQLQTLLDNGPIFIGEEHSKEHARNIVAELMQNGSVKKLFLELPNMEDDDDKEMGELAAYLSLENRDKDEDMEEKIVRVWNSLEIVSGRGNKFPMGNLIKAALDQGGISIYFHDSPAIVSSKGTETLIDGKYISERFASSIEGVRARNHYSADIIKHHKLGPHTIILAGAFHLDPNFSATLGQEDTLQGLLGCGNDRVFDPNTVSIEGSNIAPTKEESVL